MGKLVQFFREVKTNVARSPEVKAAVKQVEKQVEAQLVRGIERFVDRFERRPVAPKTITPEQRASNEQFVTGLYRDLLKREPDAEGLASHLAGLERGATRAQIRDVFLNSSEYAELQRPQPAPIEPPPTPVPTPGPGPSPRTYPEPGPALASVPPKPEYLDVPIDTSSPEAALLSTAKWVRQNRPHYFDNLQDDRGLAKDMMTEVIGILRAHGFDAHRVVNHPSLPPTNPVRWGADATVLNGKIYDLYVSYGDPNQSVPHLGEMGPYAPGRLRE